MSVKDFFGSFGKKLVKVGLYLVKFVSDAQIDIAISVVDAAVGRFSDNVQRREWAVAQLQEKLHVQESVARWLVETAVLHLKQKALEAVEAGGNKAKDLND